MGIPTLYTCLIWICSIIIASLSAVIFLGSKNVSSRLFAICSIWVAAWMISVGFLISATDYGYGLVLSRISYYFGTVIAASFILFFYSFPTDTKPKKTLVISVVITEIIFFILYIFSDLMVPTVVTIVSPNKWTQIYGPLSFLFELLFFGSFTYGISKISKKIQGCSMDNVLCKNLKLMRLSLFVGTIPPSILCIILPRFGFSNLNWIGPILEIIWIPIISYSIVRYRQMNVRVVVTEWLAIAMSAIFFVNIFIDTQFGMYGKIITFVAFLALGYFLIRSVLKEAEHLDMLNKLNLTLETKVLDQTTEIRKSYEAERHSRQDLEKLNDAKNQFIMITQHHLRTPVVSIIWFLESTISGTFGNCEHEFRNALEDALASCKRLIRIIDDFLNITAVKIGTNLLNLEIASLKPSVLDVISELKEPISKMNISVTYPEDDTSWPFMKIDHSAHSTVKCITPGF